MTAGTASPSEEDDKGILASFLQLLIEDQAAGRKRTLVEYQALFPTYESQIAYEYARVHQDDSATLTGRGRSESVTLGEFPSGRDLTSARLGPYELLERLGHGGQACVWRAMDTRSGQSVALKTFPSQIIASPDSQQRFLREVEAATRLEHPGICRVIDSGISGDTPFICMEYVEGLPLHTFLAQQPHRDHDALVRMHERLAEAVHAAHEQGVVHRDIKPGNIMVRPSGEPVLIDFGLARILDPDQITLTQSGDIFGTPAYMSPEQLARQPSLVDHRTDIWSLGVTLYESVAGVRPFEAIGPALVYQAILVKSPPHPKSIDPDISTPLANVILKALSKDCDHRYQTAREFMEDLRAARTDLPVQAKSPSVGMRTRHFAREHPVLVTSVFGTLLGLAVGLVFAVAQYFEVQDARVREQFLADRPILESLLKEQEELWPPRPAILPQLEAWMERAEFLIGRRKTHEEMAHGPALDPTPAGPYGPPGFLDQLPALERVVPSVQERIHRARNIEQWTLVDAAGAWEEARRAIAGNARYRNLDLKPQVGLVPLGPNAAGLWEFWVRDMGPVPADAGCAEARGGIVLVLIPGGEYWIGSPTNEDGRNGDEETLHCRSLAPYFIGKYEVTQRAWTQVMGENLAAYHPDSPLSTVAFTDLHPIENVSRHEVEVFCRRLALSIPTEAQWETAARGGREGPYAFESLKGNENVLGQELRDFENLLPSLEGEMNDWPDSHMYHAPVGVFSPNGYGLHDVCGNVSEWCRDGYRPRPEEIIETDPDGLLAPVPYMDRHNDSVTFRGGSWRSHAKDARCARRHRIRGVFFYSHIGLRATRAVDP